MSNQVITRLARVATLAGALAAMPVALACAGDAATGVRDATYVATLSGSNERPTPIRTAASGSARFIVNGAIVQYTVTSSGFETPVVAAFIHIGGAGTVSGPAIVPFTLVAQSGVIASGTLDLTEPITYNTGTISGDSLRALFDSGNAYINLHTAAFPGGEIRGQIVRETH